VNDEAARRLLAAQRHAEATSPGPRMLTELDRAESLALLSSVSLGRIVFTRDALPAIRPVNHALIDGHLVIRTHEGAAVAAATSGQGAVVAYEADAIDPDTHLGWSVVVTGTARLVTAPDTLARYERILTPWVSTTMEHAVVIGLDLVTGFRLDHLGDGDPT
jgi:hypothetical protein